MKKTLAILIAMAATLGAIAQQTYWVFMTDKASSSFDPQAYFDSKALQRYAQCGADPADWSNYPVSPAYEAGVSAIAEETIGSSRWLNAVGISATAEQVEAIAALPYVKRVQPIHSDMVLARHAQTTKIQYPNDSTLSNQLIRMQGKLFRDKKIDGKGIRIAVLDGGFPKVNTHVAFKHLRDNRQILKTWNFPNKKENVYGWNSHGTMTLSCIGGRLNDSLDIGLATGAEYLLARTEVEAEPFKEEVWWQMAMEWADKNGANIISSSLGYGKDRYYTRDMDGQSYVAKAANMAARKGILVFCSAGNEADDDSWQYIVTPSDADSAMCVGGIKNSLALYEHISFASFGPTADGRQKPNVCAFAHALAASDESNDEFEYVYGTSFSCPLVAGFAACAWQASPGKTNMEMFDLIQRSADLYPYCDYAFGYGVPQASFFTGEKKAAEPTFRFEKVDEATVMVVPLIEDSTAYIFYKDMRDDGSIYTYGQQYASLLTPNTKLILTGGNKLMVHLKGYTAEYQQGIPSDPDPDSWVSWEFSNEPKADNIFFNEELLRTPLTDIADESHSQWEAYLLLGTPVATSSEELSARFWSPQWHIGGRYLYQFTKGYAWGVAVELGEGYHRYNGRRANTLEQLMNVEGEMSQLSDIVRRRLMTMDFGLEIFQRVRFVPLGFMHKGLHWDIGAYGNISTSEYQLYGALANTDDFTTRGINLGEHKSLRDHTLNYGIATRLTYDIFGLYARYRLNGIGSTLAADKVLLPRLEVGMQLMF